MTKPKRVTDDDGRAVLEYENGVRKDASTGHFIQPSRVGKISTSERGRELASLRWQKAREAAAEGLAAGANLHQSAGSEAWRKVVAHMTKTLLESQNLRGQAEVGNFLGRATGYISNEPSGNEKVEEPSVLTTLGVEVAKAFIREAQRRRRLREAEEDVVTVKPDAI